MSISTAFELGKTVFSRKIVFKFSSKLLCWYGNVCQPRTKSVNQDRNSLTSKADNKALGYFVVASSVLSGATLVSIT